MKLTTILPLLLLGAATAAAQSADVSGPLSHIPQPFDVLHYDAELDLTKAPARDMSGVVDILFRWTPESATDPYFAFHLRGLSIDSVWLEGVAVAVTRVGDSTMPSYHFRIAPTVAPTPGDSAIVRITYHGRMTDEVGAGTWGGVGSQDNTLFAMGVGFMNNYVSTTHHWLPSYDHPSDKATFRGRFKTLGGFITASNGLATTSTLGDTTIYEWSTSIPTATYLLTFATARYFALDIASEPVPMVVYAQARDTARTRVSFRLLPRMVRAFESLFIPYPFEKVGYANTPIGAMEHQTMISINTSISQSQDTVNRVAAHELAHQWFGDLVTPSDYRHVWLTESFATFCESLWDEELDGDAGYLQSQSRKLSRYLNSVAPGEGILPLYDFPRTAPSSNYPETIYQKGAIVVGMLRHEMGDDAFFAALREYLRTYAYSIATTEQLRAVLESHHGAPLDWFFDQWVYAKGWPDLTITATSEPSQAAGLNRVTLRIDQTPVGDQRIYRRLAVPLLFEQSGSSEEGRSRLVTLDGASGTFVLDSVPDFTALRVNRGSTTRSLLRTSSISGVPAAADSGAIEFFVRPNPTDGTGALTVEVRGVDECSGVRYELYDPTGRRLGTGSSERCEFTIPTGGIASGAYVLRFRFRELFYDVSVVVAK